MHNWVRWLDSEIIATKNDPS